MKRNAIFAQVIIVLLGIGALTFLLWEPHLEGRNVHSTLFQIYFNDPFLAYAYIASIPFFVALYKAIKVLECYKQDKLYTQIAVKALQVIKFCAIAIVGFVVVGEILIMLSISDDHAGVISMGFLITIVSVAIALVANRFERKMQKVIVK